MSRILADEHKYLRTFKKFPTVWCPGCGIGIVLGAVIRAIARLELEKDAVAMVSGIGCSGRMPVYVDFNTVHTTHGRALPFGTGIKLAKPHMKVLVVMGDGDALAIGGNHFIHACRRNIDLSAIIINNSTYGLTGGQCSPTTPPGITSATTPYGHLEPSFDIARLAEAAGAAFVARSTVYHALELDGFIARSIEKKGFSVVEALSDCPVYYGRASGMENAAEMLRWYRDNTITVAEARGKHRDKLLRGVLVDRELPEYTEEYHKMVTRLQKEEGTR